MQHVRGARTSAMRLKRPLPPWPGLSPAAIILSGSRKQAEDHGGRGWPAAPMRGKPSSCAIFPRYFRAIFPIPCSMPTPIIAVDGRISRGRPGKGSSTRDNADLVIDAKDRRARAGLDRQPLPPCLRRLDATPESARPGSKAACMAGSSTFVSAGEVHLPGKAEGPARRQIARHRGRARSSRIFARWAPRCWPSAGALKAS